MIQAHIFYSGTVQGVGFRYAVQRFASQFGLKGWVRNLRDGRVEILIEGSKEKAQKLIEEINRYFQGYIHDTKVDYQKSSGEFNDFQIISTV